jgi:glucans biosynthesis protein C
MTATTETGQRQPFLDWLRIAAFALLVLYHVGMYYVTWAWHVKAPRIFGAIEPLMQLVNPWRMGLLFTISGAATAWMLARRPQGLLRERSARLLLPLATGMLLIVPPQPYWEVVQKVGYAGSYFDFLKLYFAAYGGFCRGTDCLVLPTWNHLWFLPYLWCYTAVLLLLRRGLPWRWRASIGDACGARPAWQLWLLPVLWLALLRMLLLSRFPTTHALIDDWFNHATYLSLFMLGVGLGHQPQLLARLQAVRWVAVATALVCWAGVSIYFATTAKWPAVPDNLCMLQRCAWAAMQWSAIVAALGFAHRHWNRDRRWRAPLTEAVFPVYLVHQTLIVLLAMAFAPLLLHAGVEAALLVLLTFAGSLGFWWLARASGPLRLWFGLTRKPAALDQPAAAASA